MSKEIKTYHKHVFVCCTEGCCGARGGEAVYQALRTEFSERKITDVLVTRTQCLGLCPEAGATVAVYPDGLWYVVSKAEEGTEIARQHLIAGRPVQRLLSQEISLEAQRKGAGHVEKACNCAQ